MSKWERWQKDALLMMYGKYVAILITVAFFVVIVSVIN